MTPWEEHIAAIGAAFGAIPTAPKNNPPARADADGWRPSGLLMALGDLVDDMSPDEMRADLERAEQERGT